jgi:acyl carrier protein
MTDADILDAIRRAVRTETGDDRGLVNAETRAADVPGWDSLAHGRIMLMIEIELSVRIDIEKTYTATRVGELIPIIRAALGAAATGRYATPPESKMYAEKS